MGKTVYHCREQFYEDHPDLYIQQEEKGRESAGRVVALILAGTILIGGTAYMTSPEETPRPPLVEKISNMIKRVIAKIDMDDVTSINRFR